MINNAYKLEYVCNLAWGVVYEDYVTRCVKSNSCPITIGGSICYNKFEKECAKDYQAQFIEDYPFCKGVRSYADVCEVEWEKGYKHNATGCVNTAIVGENTWAREERCMEKYQAQFIENYPYLKDCDVGIGQVSKWGAIAIVKGAIFLFFYFCHLSIGCFHRIL